MRRSPRQTVVMREKKIQNTADLGEGGSNSRQGVKVSVNSLLVLSCDPHHRHKKKQVAMIACLIPRGHSATKAKMCQAESKGVFECLRAKTRPGKERC